MYFYKSALKITYADSLSDMAQPCDIDLWVGNIDDRKLNKRLLTYNGENNVSGLFTFE